MKRSIALFYYAFLLSIIPIANTQGQVHITGHITAEVIEAVHTMSTIVTGFSMKKEQVITDTLKRAKAEWSTETIHLGVITINAGEQMACNIKLHEATMSDKIGNCFTIEPTLRTTGNSDTLRADGAQTINLSGTARLAPGLASGSYEGSYSLVVLYN